VKWWTVAYSHGSCQQWRAQGSCSSQTVWHTIKYIAWPHKKEINKKVWLCTNCPHSRRKEGDTGAANPDHLLNSSAGAPPAQTALLLTSKHPSAPITSPVHHHSSSTVVYSLYAMHSSVNHNYSSSLPFNIIVHVSFLLTT